MGFMKYLIKYRRSRVAREVLALYGVEIPAGVRIGRDFHLVHRGFGTVIHPDTIIGDDVQIYHQVTIGRADGYRPRAESPMERVEIGDGAILFAGSKVLGGAGVTKVGRGSILAANAVLTTSTGEYEVWAGIPAKLVSKRETEC